MALSGRSNVDFVLDLVRQQGEELLRARKELEHSQASNKIIYKIQNQLANFQNTSAQWQIRLSKIQEAFTDLMVENESMNLELQATRSTLEAALELRASIPSYMTNCSGTEHPMTQSTEDSDKASKISFVSSSVHGIWAVVELNMEDPSHMSSTSGKPGEGGPMPSGDRKDSFVDAPLLCQPFGKPISFMQAETISKEQTSLTVITDTPKEVTDVATTAANSIIGTARPEIPVPLEKPSPTHHAIAESSIGQNENQATSPTSQTNKNGDEPQQLSITGFKPLCSRLPVPKAGKAVQELFQATIGILGPQVPVYHILKSPQALLATHNTTEHMLYTVSENHDAPCAILGTFSPAKQCHLFVQNSLLGHLYYLGEYTGGVTSKVTPDEYVQLPGKTQTYILHCAKTLWGSAAVFSTKSNLLESMAQHDGIYVAKIHLHRVGYSISIDEQIREEAQKLGYN